MTVPNHAFLFAIDIDSLYTNINTQMGLTAVTNIFQRLSRRPDADILQLLDFLGLTNNDLEFNSKHYLQVEGMAMGQRYVPSYANMSEWQ